MGCKQLSYYRETTVTEDTPFVAVHHGEKTKTLKKSSIGAITGSTGASNYEGAIRSSFGSRGSMISNLFSDQIDDSRPRAFINLMFLPSQAGTSIENNHFAFTQVSSASDNTHASLRLPEYEAPASGFIVIYLSNESRKLTEVYFDDLKITVQESKVVQRDDYYPFGLSFNSWKRSTARENKLNTFQNQEFIKDLDLEWYQFKWRNHNPKIGRFFNIDPLAESYFYNSPYAFSENRVIDGRELEGLEWESIHNKKANITTIKISLKVKNSAGISESAMYSTAFSIANQVEESFSGKGKNGTTYKYEVSLDFDSEIDSKNDFYLDLVNKIDGGSIRSVGKVDEKGNTKINRIQVKTTSERNTDEISRTGAHEIGHTGDLGHDKGSSMVTSNGITLEKDNLMRQTTKTKGTKINEDQREHINKKLEIEKQKDK